MPQLLAYYYKCHKVSVLRGFEQGGTEMRLLAWPGLQGELLHHGFTCLLRKGMDLFCAGFHSLTSLSAPDSFGHPRVSRAILCSGLCLPSRSKHGMCVFCLISLGLVVLLCFSRRDYVSSNFIAAACQLLTSVKSFQVRLKVGIPDRSVAIT